MCVYLLHFDRKYHHSQHYIGYADDLGRRLERHRRGGGARLISVITGAGTGWTLARTWPAGTRDFERKLKKRKNAARLCPICKAQVTKGTASDTE